MQHVLGRLCRLAGLWFAGVFGTVLSGVLLHPAHHSGPGDGPLPASAALLIVTATDALVVAGLASRLAGSRARRAAELFIVIFALETGLSSIESAVFRHVLGMTPDLLFAIAGAGAIRAAVTALAASLLWPAVAIGGDQRRPRPTTLVTLVVLYVLLYFAAGFLIAWRSDAVRAFYHDGAGIALPLLLAIQIGRGALWVALAVALSSRLRGSRVAVATLVGAAFAVLMAAPLLYPNAFMPWPVRLIHLIELAVSNGLFGFVSVSVLRGLPDRYAAPA